jgi:hypothetical protein
MMGVDETKLSAFCPKADRRLAGGKSAPSETMNAETTLANPDLPAGVRRLISETDASSHSENDFDRLALELFAFQFDHVPVYRRFCEWRNQSPGSIHHWSHIPPLPVAAFKEHLVSSLPENERCLVFHSSGTTGQTPARHFHGATSLSLYEAALLRWFEPHFLADRPENIAFIFLTPPPASAPYSSLIHMFETIRSKFGGADSLYAAQMGAEGSWNLDPDQIASAVHDASSANRPVALLGTAFSFVHWLDHLAGDKTRLHLPLGSRLMETGGYKGRSRVVAKTELRRLMTRFLGVPDSHIVTEYGMCELSSQAYDGVIGQVPATGKVFHFPPWVRAQVISPESGATAHEGETGLLRIFDLANVCSVMALQTEDLALARADGFELLGRDEAAEPRGCSLMAAS